MSPPSGHTRVAIVEIGTNSTKFVIARVDDGGEYEIVHFDRETTRIGRGIRASGVVSGEGLEATLEAIRGFLEHVDASDHVFVVSTYALRKAKNADEVARAIERLVGSPLHIVSGKDEARFAYLSAQHLLALDKPAAVLIDVGGGSTEIVVAEDESIRHVRSLPVGALLFTERFLHTDPIDRHEFRKLQQRMDRMIGSYFDSIGTRTLGPSRTDLVASGGSVSTLARMIAAESGTMKTGPSDSQVVRRGDIVNMLDRCLGMTIAERRTIDGLEPERADIIPAGMAIVLSIMRRLRKRTLRTNPGGVREGLLIHLIENDFQL